MRCKPAMMAMMAAMFVVACSGPGSAPPAAAPESKTASETAEAADFRTICEEATGAASGAVDDRRTRFAGAVEQKLRTSGAREVWNSAGMAADAEKLAILRQGAAELKVERWDCPALAELYGPQSTQ